MRKPQGFDSMTKVSIAVLLTACAAVIYTTMHKQGTERFVQYPTIQELGLSPSSQQYLATAFLQFDPVAHRLVRFPPERSLYLVDDTASSWKQRFSMFKQNLLQTYIQACLSFPDTVFLFADDLFSGDVVVIPFEGRQLPLEITDPVLLKFFVRWNPPTNSISALVPAGVNLQIYSSPSSATKPYTVYEGATRAFSIDAPVVKVVVSSSASTGAPAVQQ